MKIWTNIRFTGFWPVGTAAVCIAENAELAAIVLNEDLDTRGLDRSAKAEDFVEMEMTDLNVRILCDGNY